MPEDLVLALHIQITNVCPIFGVAIGHSDDKTTWRVDYAPQATDTQKAAAQAVVAGFDPNTVDTRSSLTIALNSAIVALPAIDPRVKAVFVEWQKQVQ